MSSKPPRDQGFKKKESFLPQLKPILPTVKKPLELIPKNRSSSMSPPSKAIRERTEAAIKIYSSNHNPNSRIVKPSSSKLNQTLPSPFGQKQGGRSNSTDQSSSNQSNEVLMSLYQPSKFKKFYWSPDLSEYGFVTQDQFLKKTQQFRIMQTARPLIKKSKDVESAAKIKQDLYKVYTNEQGMEAE